MKSKVLAFTFLLALIGGGFAILNSRNQSTPKSYTPPAVKAVTPPTAKELLKLVNEERAKNGVAPLKEDSRLDTSAQMKADDEVKYKYFGHISPASSPYSGIHGYSFINRVGISCMTDGENLHESPSLGQTAKNIIASLNTSPAHHKAMVDPKYTLTGFGINGVQIVEHFCQPR